MSRIQAEVGAFRTPAGDCELAARALDEQARCLRAAAEPDTGSGPGAMQAATVLATLAAAAAGLAALAEVDAVRLRAAGARYARVEQDVGGSLRCA